MTQSQLRPMLLTITVAREAPHPLLVRVSAIPFCFEPALVGGNLQGPDNTVWVVCTEPGTLGYAFGGTTCTAIIHIIPGRHSSSSWLSTTWKHHIKLCKTVCTHTGVAYSLSVVFYIFNCLGKPSRNTA